MKRITCFGIIGLSVCSSQVEEAKSDFDAAISEATEQGLLVNFHYNPPSESATPEELSDFEESVKAAVASIRSDIARNFIEPAQLPKASLGEFREAIKMFRSLAQQAVDSGVADYFSWPTVHEGLNEAQLGRILNQLNAKRAEVEEMLGRETKDRSEEIAQLRAEFDQVVREAEAQGHVMDSSYSRAGPRMTDEQFQEFERRSKSEIESVRRMIESKFIPTEEFPETTLEHIEESIAELEELAFKLKEAGFSVNFSFPTPTDGFNQAQLGRLAIELAGIKAKFAAALATITV